MVKFKCTKGHVNNEITAKCRPPVPGLVEGGWLFSGECVPKICHLPVPPNNGYLVDGETGNRWVLEHSNDLFLEYGKFVDFACNPGYILFDEEMNLVESAGEVYCRLSESGRKSEAIEMNTVNLKTENLNLDQVFHDINQRTGKVTEIDHEKSVFHEVTDEHDIQEIENLHLFDQDLKNNGGSKNVLSSPVLLIASPSQKFTCQHGRCQRPNLPSSIKNFNQLMNGVLKSEFYQNGETLTFECESGNCVVRQKKIVAKETDLKLFS